MLFFSLRTFSWRTVGLWIFYYRTSRCCLTFPSFYNLYFPICTTAYPTLCLSFLLQQKLARVCYISNNRKEFNVPWHFQAVPYFQERYFFTFLFILFQILSIVSPTLCKTGYFNYISRRSLYIYTCFIDSESSLNSFSLYTSPRSHQVLAQKNLMENSRQSNSTHLADNQSPTEQPLEPCLYMCMHSQWCH